MARAPRRSGSMITRASGGRSLFNLHNQGVTRADYQGPRGSGFTVEFLSENARNQLAEQLDGNVALITGASISGVVEATDELKQKMRSYLDGHFRGSAMHGNNHRRVSNAMVQSVYYDEVSEKGQFASLIYSKFGFRNAGGFVDFLLLHMRGGTVKPATKDWLRIPNRAEAGSGFAQSGRFAMSDSDIFFVKAKDDPAKLFQLRRYRGTKKTVLLATLVKSLRIEPSLQGLEAIMATRGALFEKHFAAWWQANEPASAG